VFDRFAGEELGQTIGGPHYMCFEVGEPPRLARQALDFFECAYCVPVFDEADECLAEALRCKSQDLI
jgi:hypothetical protein